MRKAIFALLIIALLLVPTVVLASTPVNHPDNAKLRVRTFVDYNSNGVKDGSEYFDDYGYNALWVCITKNGTESCKNQWDQGDSYDDGVVTFTQLEETESVTIGRCYIPQIPGPCDAYTIRAYYTSTPQAGETKTVNWPLPAPTSGE